MLILQQNGPWILAGAAGMLLLYLLFRPRRARAKTPAPPAVDEGARELSRLRQRLKRLELQHSTQMEFFVNFPEVVRNLTAAISPGQVLSACSRGITMLLQTRCIGIFVVQDEGRLRLEDGADFPAEYRGRFVCERSQLDLPAMLEFRGVSSLRAYPKAQRFLRKHHLEWELSIPIWHGEALLGLLMISDPVGDATMVQRVLAMLADLTAVGLHAARKVDEIKDQADHDALTGLANRRTLEDRIQLELQRGMAYSSRVTLAMIDIDHFKSYNDQNGHQAGDEALKTVSKLLLQNTRRTDLVARYGGEEFTIVLSGADSNQGYQHAERIRRAIESHAFPHGQAQPLGAVTISIGLATFHDHASDRAGLFEAADAALYRAKENGRNRVESCQNPRP